MSAAIIKAMQAHHMTSHTFSAARIRSTAPHGTYTPFRSFMGMGCRDFLSTNDCQAERMTTFSTMTENMIKAVRNSIGAIVSMNRNIAKGEC